MRRKIQRSMCFVAFIALLISGILTMTVVYKEAVENKKQELCREAEYIREAVEISGTEYLQRMDNVQRKTRLTVVDADGSILYDSVQDSTTLENHKNRREIEEALQTGNGEDVRKSTTVGRRTVYYALRLSDGTVLRASQTIENMKVMAVRLVLYLALIFGLMALVAYQLSKWQTRRLIAPVNSLDVENPLENDIYEELTPLLQRIDTQNKEKEKIANMRKEFSANVSHELKTPLTSISGYAEIMKNGLVKPEDMTQFAGRIHSEASRMITLVEDIIKISKLDEESIELEKEEVNMYRLVREICARLALPAEKKNVRFEISGQEVMYVGIRQILDEMIYNMCENAVKYNKKGGKVSVWVGRSLDGVRVIVEDTGIGIPEEEQDRIFERFYRVDKSHSREIGGTGLGLAIVKHGAILHNAKIEVKSRPGEGTRMQVTF